MKRIIIPTLIACMIISCGKRIEQSTPIRKDITEAVFASGVLEAEGTYNLTARTDGYIVELNFKENDLVKQGQILAVIDNQQNIINAENGKVLFEIARINALPGSPQLVQAENELLKAKQKSEFDQNLLDRYKKMLDARSISEAEFEKAQLQANISETEYQNAQQNLNLVKQQIEQQLSINRTLNEVNRVMSAYNRIYAVKPGRVIMKNKQPGDFVRQGESIAVIGNAEKIYARVSIDESSISKVKQGQEAYIQLNTNKEKIYKGKVTEILPRFDEITQSFICRIYFTEEPEFKIAGTQLQANIIVGESKNALVIPRNYLGYGNEVMVKGETEPRRIETGIVSGEWVQVLEGIDEQTVLVTDNVK